MRITDSLRQNGLQSEFQAGRLQCDILSQGEDKIIVFLLLLIVQGSPMIDPCDGGRRDIAFSL